MLSLGVIRIFYVRFNFLNFCRDWWAFGQILREKCFETRVFLVTITNVWRREDGRYIIFKSPPAQFSSQFNDKENFLSELVFPAINFANFESRSALIIPTNNDIASDKSLFQLR